jgi:hypothetical protein
LPTLDARAASFFQVLDELSIVFAIEIVAGEPALLYQRPEACLKYINDTKQGEGLRVCAYEFTYLPERWVISALLRREFHYRFRVHAAAAKPAFPTVIAFTPQDRALRRTNHGQRLSVRQLSQPGQHSNRLLNGRLVRIVYAG